MRMNEGTDGPWLLTPVPWHILPDACSACYRPDGLSTGMMLRPCPRLVNGDFPLDSTGTFPQNRPRTAIHPTETRPP